MVVPMITYMPAPYHLAKQKLKSAIFGVGIPPVHWELCVSATTDSLGFATGALYVEKYFKEEERMLVCSATFILEGTKAIKWAGK